MGGQQAKGTANKGRHAAHRNNTARGSRSKAGINQLRDLAHLLEPPETGMFGTGIAMFDIAPQLYIGIAVFDITPEVRSAVEASGVTEGQVNVLSRHTTTAVTINEAEPRLMDDIRQVWRYGFMGGMCGSAVVWTVPMSYGQHMLL